MSNYLLSSNVPRHIAIIMDGNGRWAKEKGLPRFAGHRAGVEGVRDILRASVDFGVPILTLYAFSQENWKRPKEEVNVLMELLDFFIQKEIDGLMKEGVSVRTIGHIQALPPNTLQKVKAAIERTKDNKKLILNIALNYGSRTEILDAVTHLISDAQSGKINVQNTPLTESLFSSYLYTHDLPDPDLLIRTSGEMRLSNFLLWQLSYAEIYITKKYWPDFKREDYLEAIQEYQKRERRFGDVGVQAKVV